MHPCLAGIVRRRGTASPPSGTGGAHGLHRRGSLSVSLGTLLSVSLGISAAGAQRGDGGRGLKRLPTPMPEPPRGASRAGPGRGTRQSEAPTAEGSGETSGRGPAQKPAGLIASTASNPTIGYRSVFQSHHLTALRSPVRPDQSRMAYPDALQDAPQRRDYARPCSKALFRCASSASGDTAPQWPLRRQRCPKHLQLHGGGSRSAPKPAAARG